MFCSIIFGPEFACVEQEFIISLKVRERGLEKAGTNYVCNTHTHPPSHTTTHTYLKGQSNEIFDLQFFHNSNLPRPLTNGLTFFRVWLRIRWDIRFLGSKKLISRGIIPRGVKKKFVSYNFLYIKNVALK